MLKFGSTIGHIVVMVDFSVPDRCDAEVVVKLLCIELGERRLAPILIKG